jgi:hypothetical protein
MARSPLHYLAAEVESTSAIEKGSAVHSIVLGGRPVVSWEEGRPRRGKDYDAFAADNPGAMILTASDYAKSQAIASAVMRHDLAMTVLQGRREIPLDWSVAGRACAGTIDVLSDTFVTELKCTVSAEPSKVMWQALRMGWFAQLPWYMDGAEASGACAPTTGYIVAVESAAPYAVTVNRLTERAVDHGRRTYRGWLERLLVCEQSGEFPAYAQSIVDLDVPDDEIELDFSGLDEGTP